MATNLHTISSASEFQEKLSQDLERVSVTNFWAKAEWAEPCKQMNEVVKDLATKYETILFLQVNFSHSNTDGNTDIHHRLMRRNCQRFPSPLR